MLGWTGSRGDQAREAQGLTAVLQEEGEEDEALGAGKVRGAGRA